MGRYVWLHETRRVVDARLDSCASRLSAAVPRWNPMVGLRRSGRGIRHDSISSLAIQEIRQFITFSVAVSFGRSGVLIQPVDVLSPSPGLCYTALRWLTQRAYENRAPTRRESHSTVLRISVCFSRHFSPGGKFQRWRDHS